MCWSWSARRSCGIAGAATCARYCSRVRGGDTSPRCSDRLRWTASRKSAVRRRLGVSRWTGMSGGAHEPVLGDVGPKHAATASLALLGAAVDDELARAALGMAHGEGGVQTLRKGDVARLWLAGRIRLEPRERAHVGDHRFAPVALWPQHSNLARIASKSASR